ncbi:peptidase M38 [Streptomyces sp. Ru71]|uniref:metal-dependent hydrolase family protein n=1 Tax=Streptomyces sp. Ru71 TaxID=2080746 RepID=UPI000CDE2991|nr:amidohydrolase family protein [Streptomyces sp. Ru71]POX55349.1 peptidase M38 [Streptomyces sp. Ru71]
MDTFYLVNARIIDGSGADPVETGWIRVEGRRITGVGRSVVDTGRNQVIDAGGRTVLPGLIDAHTHLAATEMLNLVDTVSRPVLAAKTFANMRQTLAAGFTTVRDAGFTDYGFKQAVEAGLVPGPRMFLATGPLSQTGGHSDFRPAEVQDRQRPSDGLYHPGVVVDGVAQCQWGAREVLRRGADQIKIMAGGGCTSPTDHVTHTQFTAEEIAAIVQEARARHTYVMAHGYTPESIRTCVAAGVRSIEHANLVDEEAAEAMAVAGTFAVPTIATFDLLVRDGQEQGLTPDSAAQAAQVLERAYEALRILRDKGVRIGSGSDVLGAHQPFKALELQLKASVLGPLDAIVAATRTNAELLGLADDLGTLAPGKIADLLVVDGNPLDDISVLQDSGRIHLVVKDGQVVVDRVGPSSASSLSSVSSTQAWRPTLEPEVVVP